MGRKSRGVRRARQQSVVGSRRSKRRGLGREDGERKAATAALTRHARISADARQTDSRPRFWNRKRNFPFGSYARHTAGSARAEPSRRVRPCANRYGGRTLARNPWKRASPTAVTRYPVHVARIGRFSRAAAFAINKRRGSLPRFSRKREFCSPGEVVASQ